MKIIVTGSLGHIGKPLTEQLVKEGHAVTVISSSAGRQEEITQIGATPAIGSLEDVSFLRQTFASADALFAMVPPNYGEEIVEYYSRVAHNYIDALTGSSIRRVVYLSSFGAELDHGTGPILGSHYGEKLFNEHRNELSITHIRAGYFDYNLHGQKGAILYQNTMAANYGQDDLVPLVATSDIAKVVARELNQPADSAPEISYAVSQQVTANEIAQAIGKKIGKPELQWAVIPDDQMEEILQKHMPPPYAKALTDLGASLHQGRLTGELPSDLHLGFSPVTLEEFAEDFAHFYRQE